MCSMFMHFLFLFLFLLFKSSIFVDNRLGRTASTDGLISGRTDRRTDHPMKSNCIGSYTIQVTTGIQEAVRPCPASVYPSFPLDLPLHPSPTPSSPTDNPHVPRAHNRPFFPNHLLKFYRYALSASQKIAQK